MRGLGHGPLRRVGPGAAAVARRMGWGLADQAVSSLTNFALGVVVARSLDAAGFGAFGLAWVTYGVVLNLSRGLATDPLAVRCSGVDPARWRAGTARATGTALVVGVVTGAACAAGGAAVGGVAGSAFVGLGAVLPALLLQDSWRYAFFAAGRGHLAFVNDVVWAAALVPLLAVTTGSGGGTTAMVLAWGLAAAVAAAAGCVQSRVLPRPGAARDWLVEHRDLGTRYLVENVSSSGAAQVRMYGLGAIAGLGAVGAVRGGELLLGPFLAVLMGLSTVAVPEAARVLQRAPGRLPAFCLALAVGQAAAALAWGLALLFALPDAVGAALLGEVWPAAAALVLPLTLTVMSTSFATSAAAGLRALGAARRSLRAQLTASALYATLGIAGAFAGGAAGSAWGIAAAALVGAAVWWRQLHGAQRRPGPTPAAPHPSTTAGNPGTRRS
jgi:O-antigen/teichoic acid export membrane protein